MGDGAWGRSEGQGRVWGHGEVWGAWWGLGGMVGSGGRAGSGEEEIGKAGKIRWEGWNGISAGLSSAWSVGPRSLSWGNPCL